MLAAPGGRHPRRLRPRRRGEGLRTGRRLGVSDMTVRRDLQALASPGTARKGARRREPWPGPPRPSPGSRPSLLAGRSEKEAIAVRAASLVGPGSAIAVSAGTTTHAFARHLVDIPDLTVVTNSVWVADLLYRSGRESISVLVTGGLRTPSDAPRRALRHHRAQLAARGRGLPGCARPGGASGFSTPNLLEAGANRAMIRSGRRLVVLSDSSKWGVVGRLDGAPFGGARADHRHGALRTGQRGSRRAGRSSRVGRPRLAPRRWASGAPKRHPSGEVILGVWCPRRESNARPFA